VAPLPVVHFLGAGPHFDAPRAHVQQQVKVAVQKLHGEIICLVHALRSALLRRLQSAVAEEEKPIGFGGPEIKGDGAGLLGVPLGQGNVRLGRLEGVPQSCRQTKTSQN
uniref:Uncharacterized protein n=1 Tax=Pseudonaja textilis TaxID=8673 RepID=A0A670ZBZ7_PSETE